jgi:hypothetical protein
MAHPNLALQLSLPDLCPVSAAVEAMAEASAGHRGAVFTRREVVEFILDLVGYTIDKPLEEFRLLEPSMGQGDFLLPVIDRLLLAYVRNPRRDLTAVLGAAITAVELHKITFEQTRAAVLEALIKGGLSKLQAASLADRWLKQGDFLLTPLEQGFTHVVGNPPYVRQELVPDVLMQEYRRRFQTIFDRADVYVPFIEKSLSLLAPKGHLGFICADRWLKNRYGGPLRKFVSEQFHLKTYVDMDSTSAFQSDVIAYPAIVVLSREKAKTTRIARQPSVNTTELKSLASALTSPSKPIDARVSETARIAIGVDPWVFASSPHTDLVRRLENDFPTLEEAKCKVGIGVATGADQVFIGRFDELDVEPDRKLPLAMTKDIVSGHVEWRGLGVINPFGANGKLVPLSDYPRLAAYLETHGATIKSRHVSKRNPTGWYRTIDRIYPELTSVPKLLIPDIKGSAHIVYEDGKLYPHHNLYFVTATDWDLRALQAVLLSKVTQLFIASYSTKMRGGYLRYQAQYLRRLRLPLWGTVSAKLRSALVSAAKTRSIEACNSAAEQLYGLNAGEREALSNTNEAIDAA